MDWATGNSQRHGDIFPSEAIQLAALFKGLTQREQQTLINDIIDRVQGNPTKGDLFADAQQRDPVTPATAIAQATEPFIERIPAVKDAQARISDPNATEFERQAAQAVLNAHGIASNGMPKFSITPANPDIRFSIAGRLGAERLDKADGGTRIRDLHTAEQMERGGKDPRTIRLSPAGSEPPTANGDTNSPTETSPSPQRNSCKEATTPHSTPSTRYGATTNSSTHTRRCAA